MRYNVKQKTSQSVVNRLLVSNLRRSFHKKSLNLDPVLLVRTQNCGSIELFFDLFEFVDDYTDE